MAKLAILFLFTDRSERTLKFESCMRILLAQVPRPRTEELNFPRKDSRKVHHGASAPRRRVHGRRCGQDQRRAIKQFASPLDIPAHPGPVPEATHPPGAPNPAVLVRRGAERKPFRPTPRARFPTARQCRRTTTSDSSTKR